MADTFNAAEPAELDCPHVLGNPAWAALAGPQAHLGERRGGAARYHSDVSPFTALADAADPSCWADLAEIAGPGTGVAVIGPADPPVGWELIGELTGVQLVGTALRAQDDPEAVRLGAQDVPEMLDLVARTKPGPFRPRTIEMGTYLGIRDAGRLVAMAGERMRPPGWTEISAVCTDERYRGRGLATRLMRAIAAGIRDRGEMPFLHAKATNTNAIRLYETIGFALRGKPQFRFLRIPGSA